MSTIEKALEKMGGGKKPSDDNKQQSPLPSAEVAVETQSEAAPSDAPVAQAVTQPVAGSSSGATEHRMMIDMEELERKGYLTPDSARTQLSEEMRHIKRPLLLNAFGKNSREKMNLLMVTSGSPGEGKTFTSMNLAMSIAKERDKTVLLVDCDVAKPRLSRMLGMDNQKGLVDYLLDDDISISDILIKTNVPNLRLLPTGRRHIHSTELLASDNMGKLMDELSQRYPDRVVIFDSPPLLATTEASVLAGLVGQIVIVVEAGGTTKQALDETLGLVADSTADISLVLNKYRGSIGSDHYGYYGAYGD